MNIIKELKEKAKGLLRHSTDIGTILIAVVGAYFTYEYNKKQLEISREETVAGIVSKLASGDVDTEGKNAIAISLAIFEDVAIPPLIALFENTSTVRSASVGLKMIGNRDCVIPLIDLLLDRHIPGESKNAAISVIERIVDRDKSAKQSTMKLLEENLKELRTESRKMKKKESKSAVMSKEMFLLFYKLGFDLKELYLPGIDLRYENLEKIKLKDVCMKGARLSDTTLIKADFEGANLEGVDFGGANIRNVEFKNAKLNGSNFLAAREFSTAKFIGVSGKLGKLGEEGLLWVDETKSINGNDSN